MEEIKKGDRIRYTKEYRIKADRLPEDHALYNLVEASVLSVRECSHCKKRVIDIGLKTTNGKLKCGGCKNISQTDMWLLDPKMFEIVKDEPEMYVIK